MAQPRLQKRLGDLLVDNHIISEEQLQLALGEQRKQGRKLGNTLIDLGYLTERQLLDFLARQLNIPLLDISQLRIDSRTVQLLPEVHARRYRALVVHSDAHSCTVAFSDPADLTAIDAVTAVLQPRDVKLAVASEHDIVESFDRLYRRTKEIENFAEQLSQDIGSDDIEQLLRVDESDSDATVVKLLQSVLEDAVQIGASDIHIEPDEKLLRIRLRVDGMLQESVINETRVASALVLRLKLMSGLDISEKRLPQDGRFNMKVRGQSIDVRLSTMPIQHGESVVMRLLNQSSGVLALEQTGMPAALMERFEQQLTRPHGMILVTGPTGSGKTTTLYAALNRLNEPEKKIVTVEDPVEYRLSRVNQVQVNPKIGLDFSQVLRATLRQDPDILLVGEMRDHETVEIGLRGALTGHLVLSTLHTNDAITSALRLLDMGAPGYLVAASLRAVMAQRLVRRLCPHCKQSGSLAHHQQIWLEAINDAGTLPSEFYQARGCQHCNFTGYRGRIGVFEFLELDDELMDALRREDTEGFAKLARNHPQFRTLAQAALDYAREGLTSVDEVLRLAEQAPQASALNRVQPSSAIELSLTDE